MLADRSDIRLELKRQKKYFGVMGAFEKISSLPEYSNLPGIKVLNTSNSADQNRVVGSPWIPVKSIE